MKTVARTESCPPALCARAPLHLRIPRVKHAAKVKMGPEEAARKCAPQKGSPGRKRTSAKPQQHRAYASWEDENKENIDPRTRKATATSLAKPKALSPTKTDNVVKPTRTRRRRNAIVPVGSPRCVSDLQSAFAALAVASRR